MGEEDEITPKEAGWEFLRMFGKDDDEGEESEQESVYSEQGDQDSSSEEESEAENFDSEDDESDFDGDEELEEQGMDWDDMEKETAAKTSMPGLSMLGPRGDNGVVNSVNSNELC